MSKKYFKDLKIEKIFLLVISLFVFFTMYYYDNQTAFLRIQDNMHRIITGKWYYIFNGWSAIPYGILLQSMCAVWSLPVFILSELGMIAYDCVGARLWYKLFIAIFLLLDIWQIDRLAAKLNISPNNRKWLQLFFVSSLLVMLPAVHIAQFDAIYLFFIFLGLNYYFEDKNFKFLLCFMIAIPGKYMPLFIFIPLILLREKRYLYIFRDLIIGCALILVDKGMYSIGYRIEAYLGINPNLELLLNDTLMNDFMSLLHSNTTAFESQMSVVVLLFGLLCIWCYMQNKETRKNLAVFVSFLGFSILFAFGSLEPYWIILIAPFMLILIFQSENYFNILFPLEILFTIGYLYIYTLQTSWVLGSEDTFSFLLFSLIPGYVDSIHGYIADFIKVRNLAIYDGAMSGIMVACLIGIAVITYPLKNLVKQPADDKTGNLKVWYWLRFVLLAAWILLNIWVVMLNRVW